MKTTLVIVALIFFFCHAEAQQDIVLHLEKNKSYFFFSQQQIHYCTNYRWKRDYQCKRIQRPGLLIKS